MEVQNFFIDFLKSTISPIALISGVGLILLSVTNRLGRTIDRARYFLNKFEESPQSKNKSNVNQLKVLYKRSRILRYSIMAISFSILFSSLLIPLLLIMQLYNINLNIFCLLLFTLSSIGIIISAFFLVFDVILALKALDYRIKEYM